MIKKILLAGFCIVIANLAAPALLPADTIVLKSGKTIEAQIIEKNNKYIKVDLEGIPITYYREDIKSINGKDIEFKNPPEKSSLGENSKPEIQTSASKENSDWTKWYQSIMPYLAQLNTIALRVQGLQLQMQMQSQTKNKEEIFADLTNKISSLLSDLKKITPPPELELYHKKFTETAQCLTTMLEAAKKEDKAALASSIRSSMTAAIGAIQEMKQVFIKHNAPAMYIEQLDMAAEQTSSMYDKVSQAFQ